MYRDCCSRGCGLGRLPGGAAVFILVVGQLFDVAAVGVHDEYLAVGLGVAGQQRFVLEAYATAGEEDAAAIRRPGEVSVVAAGGGELLQAGCRRGGL